MSEDFFWFDFEECGNGHCVKEAKTWQFLQPDGSLSWAKNIFTDIQIFPWVSMILQVEEGNAVNVSTRWIHVILNKDVRGWIETCKQRFESWMKS